MKAVFVRAMYGQYAEAFRIRSEVAIGWFNEPLPDYTRETIGRVYRETYPDHNTYTSGQNIGQIYRFLNEIQPGDLVITTYADGRLIIGEVMGRPIFKPKDDNFPFNECIPVKWQPTLLDRYGLQADTQRTIKSSLTIFHVPQLHDITALANINLPENIPSVARAKGAAYDRESIYNSIKQVLLLLDPTEFEKFVSYVLQSLGFEATRRTGHPGDGGVDYVGTLDVFGAASIKLQVQVKQYRDAAIGEQEIRKFRGGHNRGHQLTFVTLSDFQKKAIESAQDPDKEPVNLINGKRLIEIYMEQFDKVMDAIETDGDAALMEKLRFRKVIVPE
jgi:restriction system protein